MKKLIVAAMGAVLLVGVGCQNDRDADADVTVRTERTDTMRGADDCAMCEGVQTARADGTCPQCGMKVRTSR
jgi:uncharacterized lipoprotein NlpE involved in copper resistance